MGQTALYYKLSNKALKLTYAGRLAYKAINRTAILDQVMQQGSNDTKSTIFRNALAELYNNTVGELTWRLLLNRHKQNFPTNEIASFNNAI